MVMTTIRYTISQKHCSLTLLKRVSQFVQTQQYMIIQAATINK